MKKKNNIKSLEIKAKNIRRTIVDISLIVKKCHPASSFSIVEILIALNETNLLGINRNRREKSTSFILSKAHGLLAYYAILFDLGLITWENLKSFKERDGLPAEPIFDALNLFDYKIGPLGGGLALGVGIQISNRLLQKSNCRSVVLLSDAECQKGQTVEAISYASSIKLSGLIAIIDYNQMQMDGNISEIQTISQKEFWFDLGWNVFEVDGHNILELIIAFTKAKNSKRCSVIIANTVKGKGIKAIENNPKYHYYKGETEFKNLLLKFNEKKLTDNEVIKIEQVKPKQKVVNVIRRIVCNDKKIVVLSADLLLGTGLDALKKDLKIFNKYESGQIIRLPMAENLVFRLSEGLILKGFFPIIGIFESLVSIVMLELQSLAATSYYNTNGMLVLMTKPGRSSDDGFSMRSTSILMMINSVPNTIIFDPRDMHEIESILPNILTKKEGMSFLRIADNLKEDSVYSDIIENIYFYGNIKNSRKVLYTSGWIYNIIVSYLKTKKQYENILVIGVSSDKQINRLKLEELNVIFSNKDILILSDSNPEFLYRPVSEVLINNQITVKSIILELSTTIDLSNYIFEDKDIEAITQKFINK